MFQHIGYFSVAVSNLDEAIQRYEALFDLQVMTPPQERRQGFKSATLGNGTEGLIELIQPSTPDSALGRFMKERAIPSNPNGEGVYMVSIEVDDIKKTVQRIQEQGGRVTLVDFNFDVDLEDFLCDLQPPPGYTIVYETVEEIDPADR